MFVSGLILWISLALVYKFTHEKKFKMCTDITVKCVLYFDRYCGFHLNNVIGLRTKRS